MLKKIFYAAAAVILIALVYNLIDLYRYTSESDARVEQRGLQTMDTLKVQIDRILVDIQQEAERLARDFGTRDYSQAEIEDIIKKSANSIPEIQGITACYEPYAFSDDQRLFCPYYNQGDNGYTYVEDTYDYTDNERAGTEWYTGVRENGAQWVEPYYAAAAKDWYIDYGIPFTYSSGPKKGQVRGTITMSFVASGFKDLILSLSLGKTGYGIITSDKGNFLSHPINDYVGTTNIESIKEAETQPELVRAYKGMQEGEAGSVTFEESQNEDEAIFMYDTIPVSGWSIGLLLYKNELLGDTTGQNRRYIRLGLLISGLLLVLIAIYFNKDYLDYREIWQLSVLGTALLIMNIVFIWQLEHNRTSAVEKASPPIADLASLGNFINQQNLRRERLKVLKPVPVPTGILVRRIAFENSYDLNVSGTVWQKYPLGVAEKANIGFRLPQTSPFAEASYIEEIYRKRVEPKGNNPGHLLVGFDFRTTLQQYLNYENFPFDKRHISIHIVPMQTRDNLIFVPDLGGYEFTNPTRKPGLDPKIKLYGNRITKSYFNYSVRSYNTNFGFPSKKLFEEVPMLRYNIDLRRILINVFITYLIPIFVTLMMIFILLIASSKSDERQGIIEGMAAFFFVLIFSHIDMRREIITADLIFLEYFYFITYLMIILATWNLITYSKTRSRILDFNENQLFKASFFPFFMLCVLIVTLVKFY